MVEQPSRERLRTTSKTKQHEIFTPTTFDRPGCGIQQFRRELPLASATFRCEGRRNRPLQRVQIRHQRLSLFRAEDVAESGHGQPALLDDVADAIIVGRLSAGQVSLAVESLQGKSIELTRAVSLMAARAVLAIEVASGRLLRGEVQFGVGEFGFVLLGTCRQQQAQTEYCANRKNDG